MESKFKRGDVIKEKNFERTMRYVVLDTVEPQLTSVYSHNGYFAHIRKDRERLYEKLGHIDLKPLIEQIREVGGVNER